MKHDRLGVLNQAPKLQVDAYIAADGKRLALSTWAPDGEPDAIILALHGFNDYRMAFEMPATYFAENGIMTFAYDQRGFGEDEKAGYWAKKEALKHDALAVLALIEKKYPDQPVFLMGESMGGAVALYSMAGSEAADGLILIAPAVWGKRPVNVVYIPALWLTAHIMPGKKFSGKNLKLVASDNVDALIAMSKDPLMIKKTRIDAIYGLTRVMLRGMKSASEIQVPTYLLYGELDDMVPAKMSRRLWDKLPVDLRNREIYGEGFHLLLRDCSAGEVWQDILKFVTLQVGQQISFAGNSMASLCPVDEEKK